MCVWNYLLYFAYTNLHFGQLHIQLLLLILMLASSKLWAILREVVAMEQIVFRISTYLALLEDTQLKKDQFLDKLIS